MEDIWDVGIPPDRNRLTHYHSIMPEERRPGTRRNASEDASKPKKTPNAYFLFQNKVSASTSVREYHGANWTREVSNMWHGMSESEKDPFYKEAERLSAARKETFLGDKQDARCSQTQFYQYQPHPGNESADVEASQSAGMSTYNHLNWGSGPKVPANIPKESHKDFMEKYKVFDPRVPSPDDGQGYIEPELPSQGGSAEPVVASSLIVSQAEETHHTSDSHASHGYPSSLYPPRLRVPSASPTPTLEDSSPSTTVPTPASALLELSLPGEQNAWMPEGFHHPQPYGSQTTQQYPSNTGIAESFSSIVSQSTAPSWNATLDPTFEIQKSLQPAGMGQAEDLFSSNAVHRAYSQTHMNQDDFPLEDGGSTYFAGEQNVRGLESGNGAPVSLDTSLLPTGHGFYDQTQLNQNPFLAGHEGSHNAIGGHPVGEVVSGDGASSSDFNVGDAFFSFADYQISDQTQLGHTCVVGEQHAGRLANEDAA